MKEITSHIDFLMQKHDCVIIPDFGGFVLHREVASVAGDGTINPPRVSVGFNPDLKYNDALLAESYMNVYSVSYDAAYCRIEDAVKKLNVVLGLHQPVQIGRLGTLQLGDDNHYNFTPNLQFSSYHPETFGLSSLQLKRLVDIHELQTISVATNKRTLYKQLFTGMSAAAAAVLVFFLASTPISENSNVGLQKSGFFFEMAIPSQAKATEPKFTVKAESESREEAIAEVEPIDLVKQIKTSAVQASETKSVAAKYYVVIASAGSKQQGLKALSKLKDQGFKNAESVSAGNRMRIYVAAFEDKQQAEIYRANFVKNNPSLRDAWVHTQKN